MKYIIKDTIIDAKSRDLEKQIYYIGKDGYVHDFPEYADGYSKKGYASRYIKKQLTAYGCSPINEVSTLESFRWMHIYEIIEVSE